MSTKPTYYPISEDAARRAKEANSFRPYVEGSATAEYRGMVDRAAEIAEVQKHRVGTEYHEKIDARKIGVKPKTQSKYNAQKVRVDGITFDSKAEAERYAQLVLLQKAGKISNLQRQVEFELIPVQYIDGKCVERACKYKADFVYLEDGKWVVEDVKGFKTKDYIIKRKLMLYVYGIRIREAHN